MTLAELLELVPNLHDELKGICPQELLDRWERIMLERVTGGRVIKADKVWAMAFAMYWRRRTVGERNLTRRIVPDQVRLDCMGEGGPGGQDHRFLGADTMAGLSVGARFAAGPQRPAAYVRRLHGGGVVVTGPQDDTVE